MAHSGPGLSDAWKHAFRIGAAVEDIDPSEVLHAEILKKHFSSITAENAMKWERFQPEEGRFTTQSADHIAAFAKERCISMRGHTILWHRQVPDWVFTGPEGTASPALLESRLEKHVEALVDRYKGTVIDWDVLNEVFDPDGPEGYRDSPWYRLGGSGIFCKALELARAADPKAKLFYNDYGIENGRRLENTIRHLSDLLDLGAPLHGVGIQGHWSLTEPSEETLRAALERYAALGLEIALSEIDLSLYEFEDHETRYQTPPDKLIEAQSAKYRDIFRIAADYPAVTSVTTWGVTDDRTWLNNFPVKGRQNWPLLFSAEGSPKPALHTLIDTGFNLAD